MTRARLVSHTRDLPHDTVVSLVNVLEDGSTVEDKVAVFGCEGVRPAEVRDARGLRALRRADARTASRIPVERLNEARHACPALRRLMITHDGEVLLAESSSGPTCHAVHNVEARCCRWSIRIP